MLINWQNANTWNYFNNELESFSWFSSATVQAHGNIYQAINEVTSSLATLFSHKMSVAIGVATNPLLQITAIYFSKNGLNVKKIEKDQSNVHEIITKDLLFVVLERDNPFTGEIYDLSKAEEALQDSKIFKIYISHHQYWNKHQSVLDPYQIELCSIDKENTLVFLGGKVKFKPLIAPVMNWTERRQQHIKKLVGKKKIESTESITSFESKIKSECSGNIFFSKDQERFFDRAVVYWLDINGLSLIKKLSEKSELSLQSTDDENRWETSSFCRWNNIDSSSLVNNQRYQEKNLLTKVQRGLVVFSAEVLTDNLIDDIIAVRKEIFSLSSFEVEF